MKITFIFFLLFFTQNMLYAQVIDLAAEEDKLVLLLDNLRSAKNDDEKKVANKLFKDQLNQTLQDKKALLYPFSKLTTVGVINSPDKEMRILNWNVEQDDFSHSYHCFVLHYDKRRKKYNVTELQDISFGMPSQPTEILPSSQWYGCLYYKIIPVKKGSKTLYTVLGWDHNSTMSQLKLIDVIYFTGKTVKLGSPIFKEGKTTKKRIFFEHSKKANMSLKHEASRDRIIFDHLSPESPSMKKFRSFYVPDLSYDAFVLDGSKWILNEDVIGTNKGTDSKKQTVFVKNEKTGEVEEKEIKSDWINPSDPDAPGGGSEHVAITPEDQKESVKNKEEPNIPKVNKKDKRDPSDVSFYDDVKKKKRKWWRRKKR